MAYPFMGALMGEHNFLLSFITLDYTSSYSRKILWLVVADSNNDPRFIAYYFLRCVQKLGDELCNYV